MKRREPDHARAAAAYLVRANPTKSPAAQAAALLEVACNADRWWVGRGTMWSKGPDYYPHFAVAYAGLLRAVQGKRK